MNRHLCGLSGGRDSAALAVWLRREQPDLDIQYHFSDSGQELPETYDFLDRIESQLDIKINRLQPKLSFEQALKKWGGLLPGFRRRWCTRVLKLDPFKEWIKPWQKAGDEITSYVGIRSDEGTRAKRVESWTDKDTGMLVKAPLATAGIDLAGVNDLLASAGLPLPKYYEWRSRSGCYFCFYQRPSEWVSLWRRHPDLYAKAEDIERSANEMRRSPKAWTWRENEPLKALRQPGRVAQIDQYVARKAEREAARRNQLVLPFLTAEEASDMAEEAALNGPSKPHLPCLVCHK